MFDVISTYSIVKTSVNVQTWGSSGGRYPPLWDTSARPLKAAMGRRLVEFEKTRGGWGEPWADENVRNTLFKVVNRADAANAVHGSVAVLHEVTGVGIDGER